MNKQSRWSDLRGLAAPLQVARNRLALLSGLLMLLGQTLWAPLAWLALTPLTLAVAGASVRTAARVGFLMGTVTGLCLAGFGLYGLHFFVAADLYCAVSGSVLGVLMVLSTPKGRTPRPLSVGLTWLTTEVARTLGPLAVPASLGGTQFPFPRLLQIVDITGEYGISLLVAWVSGALAHLWLLLAAALPPRPKAIFQPPPGPLPIPWVGLGLPLAALMAVLIYGLIQIDQPRPGHRQAKVAVAQGAIPYWAYYLDPLLPEVKERITQNYLDLSQQGLAQGADLIIWPETALHDAFRPHSPPSTTVAKMARQSGKGFLVGARRPAPGGRTSHNSVVSFGPDGEILDAYDKVQLVAGGESDYVRGADLRPVRTHLGLIATPVCLESLFPWLVRDMVHAGGELVVIITNDMGFRASAVNYCHRARAVLRAIEHRRTVIHASQGGPTWVVHPSGRITAQTELFDRTVLTVPVDLRQERTIYSLVGDWPARALVAAWLILLVMARLRRKGYRP